MVPSSRPSPKPSNRTIHGSVFYLAASSISTINGVCLLSKLVSDCGGQCSRVILDRWPTIKSHSFAGDQCLRVSICTVLKQLHTSAPPPQSLLQLQSTMPPNWNNVSGAGAPMQNAANVASVNSNIASQTEAINAQIMTVQEQIRQSEQNLSAQHTVSAIVRVGWLWRRKPLAATFA